MKNNIIDFSFALPAIVLICLFVYYPVAYLFRISLTNWDFMSKNISFIGLKNYIWLLNGRGLPRLLSSLKITFLYMIGEVAITVVFGLLLAMLLNRTSYLFTVMRTLIIVPKYIAITSTAMIFLWLYQSEYGFFNYLISLMGMEKVDWLGSSKTALASILFMTSWRTIGFAMMIYLSALKGISEDYFEAAAIDGANSRQRFFKITLPLLSPTTIFLVVTTFVAGMKVFNSIDLMTQGGPFESTNVIVFWIYRLAFVDFKAARASAIAVVFFILLLSITALTIRWSNERVNYDA